MRTLGALIAAAAAAAPTTSTAATSAAAKHLPNAGLKLFERDRAVLVRIHPVKTVLHPLRQLVAGKFAVLVGVLIGKEAGRIEAAPANRWLCTGISRVPGSSGPPG